MNIKFAHIWNVLDKLRDDLGADFAKKELVLEVTLVEDDPGSGKMIECLAVKCSKVVQPSNYDSYKGPITGEYTMEIFSDSENRPPRSTVTVTRDLERKNE